VFGTIFAVPGRIWMLMCAHPAFDLTALAMIYWNLESAVARSRRASLFSCRNGVRG
jgi:hypothetical protein